MNYNISISVILQLINVFTGWQIEVIAKKIGFTKRKLGLKAMTFFRVLTLGIWDVHEVNLEILAGECEKIQYGLTLSKQALWKRLKLGAELMKNLLGMATSFAIKNCYKSETMEILKQFRDVLICDATTISLPDKLEQIFKGLGGTNANSAVKIQAVFSLINRNFKSFELLPATSSDGKYVNELVSKLHSLELIIFDLGYFCIRSFGEIMQKGAYFVSRVKSNSLFYVKSLEKDGCFDQIDLLDIFKKSNGLVDRMIHIGKEKLLVRMVAMKLPEDKINERRRKANKEATSKGKMLTAYELEMLAWNIVITNATEDMLSSTTMCEIYRIRWQIELIFKSWKGCFRIDKMNNVGEHYFHCIMYGRLIIISLMTTIYSTFSCTVFQRIGRLVSFLRFFKNLREALDVIIGNLRNRTGNVIKIITAILNSIKRSLEEVRKRKTTERVLIEEILPLLNLQISA